MPMKTVQDRYARYAKQPTVMARCMHRKGMTVRALAMVGTSPVNVPSKRCEPNSSRVRRRVPSI